MMSSKRYFSLQSIHWVNRSDSNDNIDTDFDIDYIDIDRYISCICMWYINVIKIAAFKFLKSPYNLNHCDIKPSIFLGTNEVSN